MNTYLKIAEQVLKASRRPMTAKGILKAAYAAGIAPAHLHGRTQHKTLQARLSEDILLYKQDSRFYRTEPGYFFLSELEADPKIPEKFKTHFSARRRTRDLAPTNALAINRDFVENAKASGFFTGKQLLQHASSNDAIKYLNPKESQNDYFPVWSFAVVRRENMVLTYRIGRYRDDRDQFANRRSIGFPGIVSYEDQSLFSEGDFGVAECSFNSILNDLDISRDLVEKYSDKKLPVIADLILYSDDKNKMSLMFITHWSCPKWFEPTARKLSLNDLRWMDVTVSPNDISDFEPWSIRVLSSLKSSCQV